jgi:hypothetical protein
MNMVKKIHNKMLENAFYKYMKRYSALANGIPEQEARLIRHLKVYKQYALHEQDK